MIRRSHPLESESTARSHHRRKSFYADIVPAPPRDILPVRCTSWFVMMSDNCISTEILMRASRITACRSLHAVPSYRIDRNLIRCVCTSLDLDFFCFPINSEDGGGRCCHRVWSPARVDSSGPQRGKRRFLLSLYIKIDAMNMWFYMLLLAKDKSFSWPFASSFSSILSSGICCVESASSHGVLSCPPGNCRSLTWGRRYDLCSVCSFPLSGIYPCRRKFKEKRDFFSCSLQHVESEIGCERAMS